ncbi:30S ribosomal protein S8e [Candidatus Bathyarchaeota archaeon]|nr:MAG: 30S ribosomal protein S8e [Candidatus Bathyarchaeota archaeon]RLI30192.1 MAG: 30S ribosomal protein S8e [Candidatus Bathyarchaeota archaeon]
MAVWHGDQHKRKPTGGKKRPYRKKRRFERGSFPTETILGKTVRKISRRRGGNIKIRVLSNNHACVTDPSTGKTQKAEILRVVKNPANVDYNRRGVITKGAVIETSLGLARVTSRPGQHGIINAVLIREE